MTPGKDSSEFWWIKVLTIACVVISVLASVGKVPFSPDQVGSYLASVAGETGDWLKMFTPYITILAGVYAWLRTSLKKKSLESSVKE